jgi:hypothetical protein
MGRSILAVFLGMFLFMLTVIALEHAALAVYPPPPGLDGSGDSGDLHAAMGKMPAGAFLLLILGWVVGAADGAWLAATVARRARIVHGLIVGGVAMAGAIMIMLHIPHPVWIWVASLVSIPAAAYAGAWFANRGKATGPGSTSPQVP